MPRSSARVGALLTVAAIICGNAAPPMIYDALAPVLPAIARHFGGGTAGEAVAQATIAVATLGMGLAGLVAAALTLRFGFRRTMFAAWLLFGLFGTIGIVGLPAPALLASRFLLGLAGGALMAIAGIAVAARYAGNEAARAKMMGINLSVGPFTAIGFLFIAAALAEISWRTPFLMHAALGVIGMVLVANAELPPVPGADQSKPVSAWRAVVPAAPAYLVILAGLVVSNLFSVQIAFLLASRNLGDPGTVASILSTMLFALAATYMLFGSIHRRLGPGRTVMLGMAFFGVGALLCAGSHSLLSTAAGMICSGIAMGLTVGAAMTMIIDRCTPGGTPIALGLATTMIYFSGAIAPMIFVPLRPVVGYDGLYYLCSIAIAIGILAAVARRTLVSRRSALHRTGASAERA